MLAPIEVRCDRCGVEGRERYRFCQGCSLYVCDACWEAAGDACLSCLRPGLPVGATLQSAIRTTVGEGGQVHHPGPRTSRVTRTLAASAARRQAAMAAPIPRPIPTRPGARRMATPTRVPSPAAAPHRPRWRIDVGSTVRIVLMSAALAASLFVLPALLDRGAPVTAPTPAPTERTEPTTRQAPRRDAPRRFDTYVVRPGDTLRSIAARVYGDEERWRRIFEANRRLLGRPDDLVPGMELRIPQGS